MPCSTYVGRNQPGRVEAISREATPCRSLDAVEAAEGCGRILIAFVYDTVARSRRRSLREMWLAARESGADANTTFRQRILDYLAEGDISPTLERLVDAQRFNYAEWQHELSSILGADEARELRGNTARLLSSHPDHPGMLLARGFSELADDRGDMSELESALESSLASAEARYGATPDEVGRLLEWLLEEGRTRRRPIATTVGLAAFSRLGVAPAVVERELTHALDQGEEAEPGLLVLALDEVLKQTLRGSSEILVDNERMET